MRVLAVAQRLDQFAAKGAEIRRVVLELKREPVRDRGVIGGGAGIGLCRETAAQRERCRALVGGKLVEHRLIILRFDDDGDVVVVLRRRADHRGAADVDVLDALLETGVLVDGRLERVEIDHEQIDRRDAVRFHRLGMFLVVADREQPAMHLGMQGLYATIHHLRKTGQLGDVPDLQPRRRDRLGGAAGGDQFDAVPGQRLRKLDQPGLVGNGQQSAGHLARMVGHVWKSWLLRPAR